MADIDSELHEKLIEIDKIKKGGKYAYGWLLSLPIGVFMLVMYLVYPNIEEYHSVLLLFGATFILMGLLAILDIKYLFPKRMAKAEKEYQSLKQSRTEDK
jgi:hypothetical protein